MTHRRVVIGLAVAILTVFTPLAASADKSCPSKLYSKKVVEGTFQGIVCDKYCHLHLGLGSGQSGEYIAAGAVQDFETAGGAKVRVTVEDLQLLDGSDCFRDEVATTIRTVK